MLDNIDGIIEFLQKLKEKGYNDGRLIYNREDTRISNSEGFISEYEIEIKLINVVK